MASVTQEQENVLAQIDAIIALLERSKSDGILNGNSINIAASPLRYLLDLLKRFGITYDEIIEKLSEYLVLVTPVLEIALKGILLSQLKSNVDCNLDPFIPEQYRERVGGLIDTSNSTNDDRGIVIDLDKIDYYGLLNFSPMSENNNYKYFGTKRWYGIENVNKKFYSYEDVQKECLKEGYDTNLINKHADINSVYELARAEDMNAFLWFVLHKARFINAKELSNSAYSILKTIKIDGDDYDIGDIIKQTNGTDTYPVFGLCLKKDSNIENDAVKEIPSSNQNSNTISNLDVAKNVATSIANITQHSITIVPSTNIWCGLNWYVDRSRYFNFFDKKDRNYDNEFALFRLAMNNNSLNSNLKKELIFTIKPSPYVIGPEVAFNTEVENIGDKTRTKIVYSGDAPWGFHRLSFDANGKKMFLGKYSVLVSRKCEEQNKEEYTKYYLKNPINKKEYDKVFLYINKISREYRLESIEGGDIKSVLYECYPGFTVYEFNYDFIMGMQLFEPTVLTAQLIEALSNIAIGGRYNRQRGEFQIRISEITKKILQQETALSTDCFYNFSNEQYEMMQRESELKRASLQPFNDVRYRASHISDNDICVELNEYNTNATLEENINVISKVMTKASVTLCEESMAEDKYSLQYNFIERAIEMLVSIFIEALLTPKFLMILLINQKMLGQENDNKWTIETLLQTFSNIIGGLVMEIRDMILQYFLDLVMEKFKQLLADVINLIALEQIEYYTRLMKQMLNACKFKQEPNIKSKLDNVDYADIEPIEPTTMEC